MRNWFLCFALFLLALNANAIGQGAGKLVFSVSMGSMEWSDWFYLVTSPEENTTQTIELFLEGPAANYTFAPESVVIQPGEIKHVNISVKIPADYSGPSKLAGKLYSRPVVERAGQVKIVGQLSKNLEINVLPPKAPQATPETSEETKKEGGLTGYTVGQPPSPVFILGVLMFALIALGFVGGYFYFKKKYRPLG
ncbi:hypothetical protein HY991_04810 [Candidatus Micrarchaeota archaeon]|nr:hypothetical protein [Candidatus Micrarchaeota archaeon]